MTANLHGCITLEDVHLSLLGPTSCALLTAIGALLLFLGDRARRLWPGLCAAALAHAVVLTAQPGNLLNINLAHHYLGARHAVPYRDLYAMVQAALGRPQVGMRDLAHPPRIVRADPREERAYYLRLLSEREGVDRLGSVESHRATALATGAVQAEADSLLRGMSGAAAFQRDVRAVVGRLRGRDLTDDYGYNGSPFYSLLRKLDPALALPFGTALGVVSLIWQLLMLGLVVWVIGMALDLAFHERIACATLLLASWDFTGYLLPGLIFGGMWLPIAVALFAVRRGRPAIAGGAIAWAGLIKLFPFVLLLPGLARPLGRRRLLFAALCTTLALAPLSLLSGRSWIDFGQKIALEFSTRAYLANSVSLSEGLLTLGIVGSPLPILLAAVTGVVLFALHRRAGDDNLPQRMLLLLSFGGYLTHTWFNYYALAPLFLLVLLARERRGLAALLVLGTALAAALPDFDHPALWEQPLLHGAKLLPYLVIPAWLLALEFRARRLLLAAAALCIGLITLEATRAAAVRGLRAEVAAHLDRGDAARALAAVARLEWLAPRDGLARMDEGIARALSGQGAAAGRAFERAVEILPENVEARRNMARWSLSEGRAEEAARQLEAALRVVPYDDGCLADLARVRNQQGRVDEAAALLERARELTPSRPRVP